MGTDRLWKPFRGVEKAPCDLGGNNRVRTTGQTGCVETGTSEGAHASLNETSVLLAHPGRMFAPTTPWSGWFLNSVQHSRQVLETEASEEAIWPWKGRIPTWASFCEVRGWNHSLT